MVSTDTWITIAFVVLAVVLWYGTTQFTDSDALAWAVLVGVGVMVPLGVNEWRTRRA